MLELEAEEAEVLLQANSGWNPYGVVMRVCFHPILAATALWPDLNTKLLQDDCKSLRKKTTLLSRLQTEWLFCGVAIVKNKHKTNKKKKQQPRNCVTNVISGQRGLVETAPLTGELSVQMQSRAVDTFLSDAVD